ncbi:PREDICTED: histone H2A deubiquitinase MYSM1-like [Priapulus caudatus]|uniref:Histone H2A deubiquitinase MYSM1-like n=1 Tax=Priapulus caudatus TaxID=37621 RepID=A0ABM1DZE9_PRICU|nr:PREDICTED: histone H2A deubiquitinase MYSM1-like [Priapulus caudatus]
MAGEEDEVDIVGDFQLEIGTFSGAAGDILSEVPLETAKLLPEFSQHPWALETSDSENLVVEAGIEEKEKRTFSVRGKYKSSGNKGSSSLTHGSTLRGSWTAQEKHLFLKGMENFGRSWSKISQMMGSRTTLQVKNYANQHFKGKERKGDVSSSKPVTAVAAPSVTVAPGEVLIMTRVEDSDGEVDIESEPAHGDDIAVDPGGAGNASALHVREAAASSPRVGVSRYASVDPNLVSSFRRHRPVVAATACCATTFVGGVATTTTTSLDDADLGNICRLEVGERETYSEDVGEQETYSEDVGERETYGKEVARCATFAVVSGEGEGEEVGERGTFTERVGECETFPEQVEVRETFAEAVEVEETFAEQVEVGDTFVEEVGDTFVEEVEVRDTYEEDDRDVSACILDELIAQATGDESESSEHDAATATRRQTYLPVIPALWPTERRSVNAHACERDGVVVAGAPHNAREICDGGSDRSTHTDAILTTAADNAHDCSVRASTVNSGAELSSSNQSASSGRNSATELGFSASQLSAEALADLLTTEIEDAGVSTSRRRDEVGTATAGDRARVNVISQRRASLLDVIIMSASSRGSCAPAATPHDGERVGCHDELDLRLSSCEQHRDDGGPRRTSDPGALAAAAAARATGEVSFEEDSPGSTTNVISETRPHRGDASSDCGDNRLRPAGAPLRRELSSAESVPDRLPREFDDAPYGDPESREMILLDDDAAADAEMDTSAESATSEPECTDAHIVLAPPTEELFLDRDRIVESERDACFEFFQGKGSKTPDRYMKIRNFILDQWDKSKPKYLNKTSLRTGLKSCGDVNSVGRIHEYLEAIGAINFGCPQVKRNRASGSGNLKRKGKPSEEEMKALVAARKDTMRPRRRRAPGVYGGWLGQNGVEGVTIQHNDDDSDEYEVLPVRAKRNRSSKYDPFKLVPLEDFSAINPAPFMVQVDTAAMLVIDIHAHISGNEVIGLLGGIYSPEEKALQVALSEPCNSLSTGMQCEMDPVSQTLACERISQQGYKVVGWYHSHPTFAPSPSLRDIETQWKFQEWFAQGGSPFIGMIASPYNPVNKSPLTEFTCLVVSDTLHDGYRLPFRFDFHKVTSELSVDDIASQAIGIVQRYEDCGSRIRMLNYCPGLNMTYLEKMLRSLQKTLQVVEEEEFSEHTLQAVREVFLQRYKHMI